MAEIFRYLTFGFFRKETIPIKGLPGKYKVLDKMNKRWKKKIDIYMGENVKLAREWGRQKVKITWEVD